MATGTGKTYTAFQIVYRLWKAKVKKRILYLADRKVLISQTKNNDFRHFGDKIENTEVLSIDPLTAFGTPPEIISMFGTKEKYLEAIGELEKELYA